MMAKLKKLKKLKSALAPVGDHHTVSQLAKAGRISTKALQRFKVKTKKPKRGSQIPLAGAARRRGEGHGRHVG